MNIMLIIGLVAAILIIGLIVLAVVVAMQMIPNTGAGNIQGRLEQYGTATAPTSLEEMELEIPFTERVIQPMLQNIASYVSRFTPAKAMQKTRRDLAMAGNPLKTPEMFYAIRFVAGVFGIGIAFAFLLLLGYSLWFSPLGFVLGYLLPAMWLGNKIKARQDEIVKSMPDVLDLLVICVEAGLGFQGAMAKVAEKWDNEIGIAFTRVLQEVRVGKQLTEALREMEQNMGVADMTSFVAAIIQATTLGVSIAKVLRIQSDQMRTRRRQRAEQKAQEAPIKMLFPMVFLIFPSLFIVLLGPAVLQIIASDVMGAL